MVDKFTCLIVDDEQDAIDLLKSRIELLYDNIIVKDSFQTWQDALHALRNNTYDIVFMDVSIPGKTGFDILNLVHNLEAEIIFVTAHENFALKAFSVAASGYVLKPIDDNDLTAAIEICFKRIKNKHSFDTKKNTNYKLSDKIGIPSNYGIDYVNIKDVLYLESVNKCTQIITENNKYTTTHNIGTYKYLADQHSFFLVHRSFLVNLDYILRYESSGILIMKDKREVPVARNIKAELLKIIDLGR
jgi:two-component system LytT family response regulator